jgi:thioredoxin 1
MIAPTFEKLSKQYSNVNFGKVDVDEAPDVARKYSVTYVLLLGNHTECILNWMDFVPF